MVQPFGKQPSSSSKSRCSFHMTPQFHSQGSRQGRTQGWQHGAAFGGGQQLSHLWAHQARAVSFTEVTEVSCCPCRRRRTALGDKGPGHGAQGPCPLRPAHRASHRRVSGLRGLLSSPGASSGRRLARDEGPRLLGERATSLCSPRRAHSLAPGTRDLSARPTQPGHGAEGGTRPLGAALGRHWRFTCAWRSGTGTRFLWPCAQGQEASPADLGVRPCPPLEGGRAALSASLPQPAGRARPWPGQAGLLQPHHPPLRGQWGNGGLERQGPAGPLSWAEAPGQEIEPPPVFIAASVFPFTGLFIHSFTHGLTHSLIHPVIHSFRPSLVPHPFIRSAPARAVEPAEDRAQELGEPSPAPAPAGTLAWLKTQPWNRESHALLQLLPGPRSKLKSQPGKRESHPLLQILPGRLLKPQPRSRKSHPLICLLLGLANQLKPQLETMDSHPLLHILLESWSLLRPQPRPRESSLSNTHHPQLLTHPFHLLPHHNLPSSPTLTYISV
nr:uncharacterized protein LOC102147648 [Equus caballus]